jgi:hypothetical protein
MRPTFEQSFGPSEHSLGQFLHLLVTRYGCDSALVRSGMGLGGVTSAQERTPNLIHEGMLVCADLAPSGPWPMRVRAWQTTDGLREEWTYQRRASSGIPGHVGGTFVVYLDGPDATALRVRQVSP